MSFCESDIPAASHFELHAAAETHEKLQVYGPEATILGATNRLSGKLQGEYFAIVGKLLIPETAQLRRLARRESFVLSSCLIVDTFSNTTRDPIASSITLGLFRRSEFPMAVACADTEQDRIDGAEQLSEFGIAAHDETAALIDAVSHYFTEVYQGSEYGKMSRLGLGFALYRLDQNWETARDLIIDSVANDLTRDIDWQGLLSD